MKIVAVTSCSTGIAQTYMAADVLERCARAQGHTIKVETQGALGILNPISLAEIKSADLAIITCDVPIDDVARFRAIKTIEVTIDDILKSPQVIIKSLSVV